MKLQRRAAPRASNLVQSLLQPSAGRPHRATLIPGRFIGPELTGAVQKVLEAAEAPVEFDVLEDFDFANEAQRQALRKNRFILAGNTASRSGVGFEHTELYRFLGLYGRIVQARMLPGAPTRHPDLDVVVVRENLEGAYAGTEHEITAGVFESVKVVTRARSLEIAELAFAQAFLAGRKRVTVVHKANIMKVADGLFLEATREVAKRYPTLAYAEIIIDNCTMQLVQRPQQFDVMLTMNLYGGIISSIVSALVGGPGVTPAVSVGAEFLLFEQGCRHAGRDISGRDAANPTGLLFAAADMLRAMQSPVAAERVAAALRAVYAAGKHLPHDVGGRAGTAEFVQAVCDQLQGLK